MCWEKYFSKVLYKLLECFVFNLKIPFELFDKSFTVFEKQSVKNKRMKNVSRSAINSVLQLTETIKPGQKIYYDNILS